MVSFFEKYFTLLDFEIQGLARHLRERERERERLTDRLIRALYLPARDVSRFCYIRIGTISDA